MVSQSETAADDANANIIDSSAWIEYFTDGPGAGNFANAIQSTQQLIVPAITITEVFRFALREAGESPALEIVTLMRLGQVIPLTNELAVSAAKFGHELKLPLADSIIYATAIEYSAIVWTQDADFSTLPNVRYFEKN